MDPSPGTAQTPNNPTLSWEPHPNPPGRTLRTPFPSGMWRVRTSQAANPLPGCSVTFILGAQCLPGTFCPSLFSLPSPDKIPAGFRVLHLVLPQPPGIPISGGFPEVLCAKGEREPCPHCPRDILCSGTGDRNLLGLPRPGDTGGTLLLPKPGGVGSRGATGAGLSIAEGFTDQGSAETSPALGQSWDLQDERDPKGTKNVQEGKRAGKGLENP